MPNCDFYATAEDLIPIVDFIFRNDGWTLFELASRPDMEVKSFNTSAELALEPHKRSHHFVLYAAQMRGSVNFRRIALQPGAVPGASFRYATEGWGLIQFYVELPHEGLLRPSHTNHFSEKAALKWSGVRKEMSSVDGWDWRAVSGISRRLNQYIRGRSVAKHGSRPILAEAKAAFDRGALRLVQ